MSLLTVLASRSRRVPRALHGVTLLCAHLACAGPFVHWTFDLAGDGDVVQDAAGACHGKLTGGVGPDLVRPGIFGQALLFDAGKRRVRFPHHVAISLRNAFTIEYVIKPFRTDSFRTILWKGDRTVTPEAINYYVDLRDGRPELKTKDAAGRWIVYSTPTVLRANEWHHVVIIFNSGEVEIFANGRPCEVRVSESGKRSTELLENTADAAAGDGASPNGSAYHFFGLIDDLKIHHGRKVGILGEGYHARWRRLRSDCRAREAAFEHEQARRAAEARQQMEREYDALLAAKAAGHNAPFIATVLPSTERLNGSPDFFRHVRDFSDTAVCSAARREYEGFQIILMGGRSEAPVHVSASVSDLVRADGAARIPASQIAWGRIERVTTEKPDLPVEFVGAIPDVIVEDGAPVSVRPRDFGAIFCRIHTGDAPPGQYEGKLMLTCGKHTEAVRIALTVYDFALPQRPSLRTAFCFFEHYYRKWYGLKTLTDSQRESIYEFLLRYRLSPCNIYSGDAPFPGLKFLDKYRDRINFFTVGRIRGRTDEQIRQSAAERAELLRRLRKSGLEEFMYFYSFDELAFNTKHLPAAVKVTRAMRTAWPKLKMMQTSFPTPELQPLFNVWAPLFHEFGRPKRLAVIEAMRARGDRIWWYAADAPRHPCPNFFLDYPVFDCRIIGTLSYLHNVEGVLYWCVNREWATNLDIRNQWPNAQWKSHIYHAHTGKRKYKNGMGNLVYPGRNGALLSSLRLENLRDGLEDYEYWCALRQALARLEAQNTPAARAWVRQARALLTPPPEVAQAINVWSHDPRLLLQYRDRVGRMIESATKR